MFYISRRFLKGMVKMGKARVDLLKDWTAEKNGGRVMLRCPKPDGARGFYPYGFVRKNDCAADFVRWYGLFLTLYRETDGMETVSVTAYFAEGEPLAVQVPALFRNGEARLEIPFRSFPIETAKGNRWEFVTSFQIQATGNLGLQECTARRKPCVYLDMPLRGKSGEPGDCITYQGTLYNCASEPVAVSAEQVFQGWESLEAEIRLDGGENRILAPGEGASLSVSMKVHDDMVSGGHETTVIRACGQGGASAGEDSVKLLTMRSLPHPYLYHNAAKWREVRENIDRYQPYGKEYEMYREKADCWTVTEPLENRPFCYDTKNEDGIMSCAYLFALTGKKQYAEKLADFFRRFTDPENGYPARKRGCSQSYVQEGHFFKHLAVGYDILLSSGILTNGEKAAVEGCFRLYMEMLDVHILDGHISNWILSELQGALFCALTLQDMERAERFAFGPGGIVEQFQYGIFNDGWWHECSVGYNTWVSSIMLHAAHALLPFGYNLVNAHFPIPFNKEVSSTYHLQPHEVKFGMFNRKWGGNRKNYTCIKDMFDAPLPFLDYRGVMFGVSDSDEKRLTEQHFGSTYDLAYYYYRDPAYLPMIAQDTAHPIFGMPEHHMEALRSVNPSSIRGNAFSGNIGLALLRSQKPGREQREQIQAVLRYGSHGNAHGHFDIADMLSVMRYGRSFYNPENCWWGYAHFMYKFYVQNSLTKNMVVVDEKMQDPADSRLILWHSEDGLQAAGVEVKTTWSYPPYGGMVYEQDGQTATKEELRKRCKMNRCYLPIQEGEGSPEYGELTGFTEPVLQKRIMAVTDDYIVLFDYLEGEQEHQFDSLMQIKGFQGIEGESVVPAGHTEQMNANPISDAQFITDCNWYDVKGGSVARFHTIFTEDDAGERMDRCDRSNYNEPGVLNMDIHTAWPRQTKQMVGRVAIYDGWAADGNGYAIPLSYRLDLDGKTADSGAFDGWILGRGEVSADVRDVSNAVLALRQGDSKNEIGDHIPTPQGAFWGEICLELEDGTVLNLGECLKGEKLPWVHMDNVDEGSGVGCDYKGGRVTIVGTEYPYALGASPIDHNRESCIRLDLTGLHAVKLTACVGVDAFPGDEWQRRKTYAVRSFGKVCRYVTVVEPYETESVIENVEADSPDSVSVTLKEGTVQTITIKDIERENPSISWMQQKGMN